MNYYPFHVGDYMTHTAHLSPLEDLAYRRLLDLYYISETCLPSDAAACARKIRMRDNVQEVQQVLSEFFTETPEGWTSQRCDEEIKTMREKQAASEKRDAHERDRMRRHRERRAEMFDALRAVGIVPAWDLPMKDLQRLLDENCNAPATDLQREQVVTCNAPATAIPTPIPTPIVSTPNGVIPPTPIEASEAPRRAQRRNFDAKRIDLPPSIPPQAWEQWIDYRRSRGLTVNERTSKAQAAKLDEWAALGQDPTAVIERSITNGWQGLFQLPANNMARSMRNGTNGQLSERLRVAGEIFGAAATPEAGGEFIEGASRRLNG